MNWAGERGRRTWSSRDIEGTSGAIIMMCAQGDPLSRWHCGQWPRSQWWPGPTQGQVIIEESGGFTDISETTSGRVGTTDTYIVYLAKAPTSNVYVTVYGRPCRHRRSSPTATRSWSLPLRRPRWILPGIITVNGQRECPRDRAIVLVFTPTKWSKADASTVSVGAVNDTRAEGDRVGIASIR